MKTLRIIFWDQLNTRISSLKGFDKNKDIVLMAETWFDCTYVPHHKKKLVFILSCMRHFYNLLKEHGYKVKYKKLPDKPLDNEWYDIISSTINTHNIKKVIITEPSDYYAKELIDNIITEIKKNRIVDIEVREDDRFLISKYDFSKSYQDSKTLRMEFFYRNMRKKYNILMKDGKPVGGKWNYDSLNRKKPPLNVNIPNNYQAVQDEITKDVLKLVEQKFKKHFGDCSEFSFAVTREQALRALNKFIKERLEHFGDYQDAMLQSEAWMYHSHISFYLNVGLLLPLECINKVEQEYYNGHAPLNAVEGFIRQILGWREFVRGIYWLKMPKYEELNFFNHNNKLPSFYWTAKTSMNCLKQAINETKENAYAHHIQRLMVLGNFALLAGINPKYINEWFWVVYADAFHWVELPNVTGMAVFADGGYLASKPYASGGAYINKMSDYCKSCVYNVKEKNGPNACPFNYLYWNFLSENREKLISNGRMQMMYKVFDKFTADKKKQIEIDSLKFLSDSVFGLEE